MNASQIAAVVAGNGDFTAGGITGTFTVDKTQYATSGFSTAVNASAVLTVTDATLTASEVATLGADAKVDTIRVTTLTVDKTQYAAASAKLNASDTITVTDATLTASEVATLGADAKVDTIALSAGAATAISLNKAQYDAATAKLTDANEDLTLLDSSLTAADFATYGVDAIVDHIEKGGSISLSAAQLTSVTNAKLTASDVVTVTLAAADALSAITNIDKVNVGVSTVTGAEAANAGAVDGSADNTWDLTETTLTYWDSTIGTPAAVSVTLTGVTSVTLDGAGVFSIA
jgi:hypothetical protein